MARPRELPPTRDETVQMVRAGFDIDVATAWAEARRRWSGWVPDLSGADLIGVNLSRANLAGADLRNTRLSGASFARADLTRADMRRAELRGAGFEAAVLADAVLTQADLAGADLSNAQLSGSHLTHANLDLVKLRGTTITAVEFGHTLLTRIDMLAILNVADLASCRHIGPSSIDTQTLKYSRGRLPDIFLRGCGLEKWEVEMSKLYDPTLGPGDFTDRLYKIFDMRIKGPIGGVFVSYSHADAAFVDKIHDAIYAKDINVWRDVHDLVAGPMARQVIDAIRRNDVVLLVLSKSSVSSDWVEFEMEKAREREKRENRTILCPIAIDDAWKSARDDRPNFAKLARDLNIIAFNAVAPIRSSANAAAFEKLIHGMKLFYGDRPPADI